MTGTAKGIWDRWRDKGEGASLSREATAALVLFQRLAALLRRKNQP